MVLQPRSPTFFPRAKQAPHNTQHTTRGDTDTDTQRYFYRPQPAPTFTHVRFTTVEWWKRGDCAGTGALQAPRATKGWFGYESSQSAGCHIQSWPHPREPLATPKRATGHNQESHQPAGLRQSQHQVLIHGRSSLSHRAKFTGLPPPPPSCISAVCARCTASSTVSRTIAFIMYMAAHHWEMQHPHLQNRPQNHPACSLVRPEPQPLCPQPGPTRGRGSCACQQLHGENERVQGSHTSDHTHACTSATARRGPPIVRSFAVRLGVVP